MQIIPEIQLNGQAIEYKETFKYLGVQIHIKAVTQMTSQ